MTDLSQTIAPKSDQLNADDLIGGSLTVKVTRVSRMTDSDQPIAIYFEGDNGKPYKPCKSMRRVLVKVWGNDGTAYAGRRMTLYRDDAVLFGGVAVGGIRISHMSGITQGVTMALTDKRGSRKPYVVKPLADERASDVPKRGKDALFSDARAAAARGSYAFDQWKADLPEKPLRAIEEIASELSTIAAEADAGSGSDDADRFPGADSIREQEDA